MKPNRLEGLLSAYMGSDLLRQAARHLSDARAAHSGLLNVFFQVEGTATTAELKALNRVLNYLSAHIKQMEAKEPGAHYREAESRVAELCN